MTMIDITANPDRAIRRILVALNSCSNEQSTIEAAVVLARQLEAELAGLFVEDVNLRHLAELPFAHEIIGTHLQKRLFDMAQLQRSMRSEMERVRQVLMRWAEQQSVSWSFLQAQGQLLSEVATATESMDLLVIGRECQGAIVGIAPAEMARRIVQRSRCSVLIAARQQSGRYQAVNILVDNSSGAMHALQSGLALAQMERLPVRLSLIAADVETASKMKVGCLSSVAGFQHGVTFELFPSSAAVVVELASVTPMLLVFDHDLLSVDEALFKQLFQSVSGPILIVR